MVCSIAGPLGVPPHAASEVAIRKASTRFRVAGMFIRRACQFDLRQRHDDLNHVGTALALVTNRSTFVRSLPLPSPRSVLVFESTPAGRTALMASETLSG